jgi:Uma2 family endonuclease
MTATNPGFEERGDFAWDFDAPWIDEQGRRDFLFDFDQFERMDEAGVFEGVAGRFELVEGKIIQMAPASADHGEVSINVGVAIKNAAQAVLTIQDLKVLAGSTLHIDHHNAPLPDVLVIQAGASKKFVQAAQAVLVVEISIATRRYDLTEKSRLYALADVPEYWVVESKARRVTVFRAPRSDGTWTSTEVLDDDAYVSPLFSPDFRIPLSELF